MHALQLTVSSRDGALVRVLGLAERRGFTPVCVGVESTETGSYAMSLGVESDRPPELLARQLGRLTEVRAVKVLS